MDTEDSRTYKTVKVHVMPIPWLYRNNKTFGDLLIIINKASKKNPAILKTKFVINILDGFPWKKNKLVWEQFIPFMMYMNTTIFFLMYSLQENTENTLKHKIVFAPVYGATLVLTAN